IIKKKKTNKKVVFLLSKSDENCAYLCCYTYKKQQTKNKQKILWSQATNLKRSEERCYDANQTVKDGVKLISILAEVTSLPGTGFTLRECTTT
ncbi:hypothetical protein, partial [Acinetobacter baumannii]|uniref:hypothetical protein n=1 Tax=Acinetobacter baumannii TaxID=470 RepID=UPI001C069600